jgi:hypothetical protein
MKRVSLEKIKKTVFEARIENCSNKYLIRFVDKYFIATAKEQIKMIRA